MTRPQRVLVLDGNCSAALGVVQSLGRAGYRITLAAPSCDHVAFRSRFVAEALRYPDPMVDRRGFQKWAQTQSGYDLVIPTAERTLIPLDEIRDHDALRGRVALPPPKAVAIGFDKEQVRALAEQLDIACPPNLILSQAEQLDAPELDQWLERGAVVLKSVRSKVWSEGAGRDLAVRMVTTRDLLRSHALALLQNGAVQAQAWVPGHGVGICLLMDRGRTVLSFAHERIHELPLTGGGSSYRRSIDVPGALLAQSERLLRALDWHGVAMVEFRLDPRSGRSFMMELNGRFWGSLSLALFAGVDFPLALARLLLDGQHLPQPRIRKVYARQFARDLDWLKEMASVRLADLRGRRLPDRERRLIIERSVTTSLLEWGRPLLGLETWDGAALDDPWPTAQEIADVMGRRARGLLRRGKRHFAGRRALRTWERPLPAIARVLVLCSGNICRSAYAAARLRSALAESGIEVRSGALVGPSGRPSPELFQSIARARGVDLSLHRSHAISDADLAWADLVLIMDDGHDAQLTGSRAAAGKVRWLGAVDGDSPSIADPISMATPGIEAVLDRLDLACHRVVERISRRSPGERTSSSSAGLDPRTAGTRQTPRQM